MQRRPIQEVGTVNDKYDYPPIAVLIFYFNRVLFNYFGVPQNTDKRPWNLPCLIWINLVKLHRKWMYRIHDNEKKAREKWIKKIWAGPK